jgi:hypothetical protein
MKEMTNTHTCGGKGTNMSTSEKEEPEEKELRMI